MSFQPDIFVNTPDGRVMVIEAKLTLRDRPSTEQALKGYMIDMQFPFGMLITPTKGWVYRDSYHSLSPGSVEVVEEFDTTLMWDQNPPSSPRDFEALVQRWFEDLADFPTQSLTPKLKGIVQEHLLPAIATGTVTAAHPR